MGRKPCCAKVGLNRGAWSAWEDKILVDYIEDHGEGKWRDLPKRAGLNRCGKSCRLRWLNYLRPDIKRGNISVEEEELILRLHRLLGNRWALIAGRLPGRTDNEIKNYWNTNLRKKVQGKEKTSRQSRKPLESSKELDDQPSRMKKLKSPLEPPRVIRTKAVRCNKVSLPQINHTTADPEKPSLSVFQEANSPDLLMNLDVDYVSLLEALDFQDVVQDREIGNRCDNTTTLEQCCGCGGRNDVSCQPQSSASEHENLMDHARQEHNGDSHDDPFQSEDDAFDLIDLATIF